MLTTEPLISIKKKLKLKQNNPQNPAPMSSSDHSPIPVLDPSTEGEDSHDVDDPRIVDDDNGNNKNENGQPSGAAAAADPSSAAAAAVVVDSLERQKAEMDECEEDCVYLAKRAMKLQEQIIDIRKKKRRRNSAQLDDDEEEEEGDNSGDHIEQLFNHPETLVQLSEADIATMTSDEEERKLLAQLVDTNQTILYVKAYMTILHGQMMQVRREEARQQEMVKQDGTRGHEEDDEKDVNQDLIFVVPDVQ